MDDKDVTVKIYLASELRARFKAKCALQERSMNEVLLEFINDFVEETSEGKINDSPVTHQ